MKKSYTIFFLLTLFIIIFTFSAFAQFVRVTSEFANIRLMPDTESIIIGKAFENDIFGYEGEENDWIKINMFSGEHRYIHHSLVKVLTLGISTPFSDDVCPELMERLEEARERSLTESDVESQNVYFDRNVLDIFHEFNLQPVAYQIAVNRCIEGPESKIGQRPTVEKEKVTYEYEGKTEVKEPVKDYSPWYDALETFALLGIIIAISKFNCDFNTIYQKIINFLKSIDIDGKELPADNFPQPDINLAMCPICLTPINQQPAALGIIERSPSWIAPWKRKKKEPEDSDIHTFHMNPLIESKIRHNAKNVRFGHRWCVIGKQNHTVDYFVEYMNRVTKNHKNI